MRKIMFLLCALMPLYISAQKVSESEAFEKAELAFKKKLKKTRAITRSEQVYKPFYVFNAEDGKGSIIITGDKKYPEVLVYSNEKTIDEDNIPEELKELIPMLNGYDDGFDPYSIGIPSEYTPRNTTPVVPMLDYEWWQGYPYNQYCPITKPNRENENERHALVGCTPLAVSMVMAYFKYPSCANSFDTRYRIRNEGESTSEEIRETIQSTEFKWDLIRKHDYSSDMSDEEQKAIATLCYNVGLAFRVSYRSNGTVSNSGQEWVNWESIMKDIYKYEEAEFIKGGVNTDENDNREYYELPDEEYWKFLDSYLERGVPVVAGGGNHTFVIDGRDDKGMYYYYPYYVILQPSLWRKIGNNGALIGNNYWLHLLAFVPPKEYIPAPKKSTAIVSVITDSTNDGYVYNLQGHKVSNTLEGLPKGIYIKDGKKYIVK